MKRTFALLLLTFSLFCAPAMAQNKTPKKKPTPPSPEETFEVFAKNCLGQMHDYSALLDLLKQPEFYLLDERSTKHRIAPNIGKVWTKEDKFILTVRENVGCDIRAPHFIKGKELEQMFVEKTKAKPLGEFITEPEKMIFYAVSYPAADGKTMNQAIVRLAYIMDEKPYGGASIIAFPREWLDKIDREKNLLIETKPEMWD